MKISFLKNNNQYYKKEMNWNILVIFLNRIINYLDISGERIQVKLITKFYSFLKILFEILEQKIIFSESLEKIEKIYKVKESRAIYAKYCLKVVKPFFKFKFF